MEESKSAVQSESIQDNSFDVDEPTNVANPGRRWLLKALTAGGVAAAASFVPKKWSTPGIEGGVLPAHAQISPNNLFCSGSEAINLQNGQTSVTLNFSASTYPTPVEGLVVHADLDTVPPLHFQATTNSSGQAFFNDIQVQLSNVSGDMIQAILSLENWGSCLLGWTLIPFDPGPFPP